MQRIASWAPVSALRLAGLLMAGVAVLTVVTDAASPDVRTGAIRGLISLVAVVGLYTFMGNSGVVSFGQVSFAAVGAYGAGLLLVDPLVKELQQPGLPGFIQSAQLSAVWAILIAGALAAVVAAVLCAPIVRLSGLAAGLATFSILVIVQVVLKNWESVTRGTKGLNNVPADAVQRPMQLLPWALLSIFVAALFQVSRAGLRLRASREDEYAAIAVGIRVRRERAIAFLLSAFLFGIAGALLGQFIGTFGPDTFYLVLTFQIISMLIIGGMTSLAGAVVGTVFVTVLTELLLRVEPGIDLGVFRVGAIENLSNLGIALATLLVLVLRPDGLMGGRELALSRVRRGRRREADVPATRGATVEPGAEL